MPEYLAPGVYVEETSFRSKSIEGVSTSTTGFVGATRYGPTDGEPELMTSFNQFERIYGGLDPLNFENMELIHNYLAHAVRAFFDNGGSRLYIARAYTKLADGSDGIAAAGIPEPPAELEKADTEAKIDTASLIRTLDEAIAAGEKAKETSSDLLKYAANEVLKALQEQLPGAKDAAINILKQTTKIIHEPAIATINYDYGTGDNVEKQLEKVINALPDGDDKTKVKAEFGKLKPVIQSSDKNYKEITSAEKRTPKLTAIDILKQTTKIIREPAIDTINYDYGTGDNVEKQLEKVISALPDGSAKTNVLAEFEKLKPVIQSADKVYEVNTISYFNLGKATTEKDTAKNTAIDVLKHTVAVVSNQFPPSNPLVINYDYGAGNNVEKQLEKVINDLPDGNDKTKIRAEFEKLKLLIQRADISYAANYLFEVVDSHLATLAGTDGLRNKVSNAYEEGVLHGKQPAEETLVEAQITPTQVSSAKKALEDMIHSVDTEKAELSQYSEKLSEAQKSINDNPKAVLDADKELIEKIESIAACVQDESIREIARLVTLGKRIAEKFAKAHFYARFPGMAGNLKITITGRLSDNVLQDSKDVSPPAISQIRPGDLVVIKRGSKAPIYYADGSPNDLHFHDVSGVDFQLINGDNVYPLFLSVQVAAPGKFSQPILWDNLTISTLTSRVRDSLLKIFAQEIPNRMQELETPFWIDFDNLNPSQLAGFLLNLPNSDWQSQFNKEEENPFTCSNTFTLTRGSDGQRPATVAYEGSGGDNSTQKKGLKSLEDLEEISIVAAPGYSHDWSKRRSEILTISNHLINHCEKMRYRVAILDSPNDLSLSGVREYRALLDNKRSALYYPWIRVLDPISNQEINLPPSGFVAGIYARNDVEIGVHKAPANEVARSAIGLETLINKGQQDVLNPLGINCIRYFEGRGIRVWGARTISSDPEWKYLNVRRHFIYLEASIDRSTQWAVFEPNGERLWANIRRTVESFLENEWREGRLAGTKVEQAFFVRCDRSTMTQNDIDNGRMICLIGVAPLYPAEFVIFRIGQWTADARR